MSYFVYTEATTKLLLKTVFPWHALHIKETVYQKIQSIFQVLRQPKHKHRRLFHQTIEKLPALYRACFIHFKLSTLQEKTI